MSYNNDLLYLIDIKDSIILIKDFIKNFTYDNFINDKKLFLR